MIILIIKLWFYNNNKNSNKFLIEWILKEGIEGINVSEGTDVNKASLSN